MIFQVISREFAAKRTNLSELREHLQQLHTMSQIYSDGKYTKIFLVMGTTKT